MTAQMLDPGTGLDERMVTLADGRRIRTVIAGTGSPTVVFEAGLGAPAGEWTHVQREVSAWTSTLSYDRAGFGGSDVDQEKRTLERLADDLAGVLDASGVDSPVVFVGHSWGGPVIRLLSDREPHRVAGLVLIDTTIVEVMPPYQARVTAVALGLVRPLLRLGLRDRLWRQTFPHGASPDISAADLEVLRRDYLSDAAFAASRREAQRIVAALPVLERLQEKGLPDVPVVALVGGRVDKGTRKTRPIMNEVTARHMAATRRGTFRAVPGAGHLIPHEKPQAVVDAVREVVEQVRAR